MTLDKAGLWTDSRYFLQATTQLEGSTIDLYKMGVPGTPSIEGFLAAELPSGAVVAADGACLSAQEVEDTRRRLEVYGIEYHLDQDLLEAVWKIAPPSPISPSSFIPLSMQVAVLQSVSLRYVLA